jgi:uncharacterized MAPEG superfamily protein
MLMTITLWSLMVAAFLPYVWFGVATRLRKAEFGELDANHPRTQEAKQTGAGARAMGAHGNAFEALMVWAPAVLAAHLTAPDSTLAPKIAIGWMAVRLLHGIAYIRGMAPVRSMLFALGMVCAVLMYLVAGHVL